MTINIHRPKMLLVWLAGAVLALCLLTLVGAKPTWAATITVNTTADEQIANGACSLREAVLNANGNDQSGSSDCAAGSGEDAIVLDVGSSTATITLVNSQLPEITDSAGLSIDGENADITVSGNDSVRVLSVASGAKLALENLTVAHGLATAGGGIFNANGGTLTVTNSTISGNRALFTCSFGCPGGYGGGIYNGGTATISGTSFLGNSAGPRAGQGGGINTDGTLTVTDSTFSGNSAGGGGGLRNDFSGKTTVTNSTFSGNSAGGGGGIFDAGQDEGAYVRVTNSVFSGNSATSQGGAIHTINRSATPNLRNTILTNSPSGGNCSGWIGSGGYNIDDGTTCGFGFASASKSNTDPRLDPDGLQDNGGPTKTIALQEDSPAIDAIPQATNDCGTAITTDQRGEARPQGPACDIGAFEAPPDVTPPGAPAITSPQDGSLKPDSFTISGTAEAGSTVELFEGSDSRGTDQADSSGLWSISLNSVSDGSHAYRAKATDAAGNTSAESEARTVIVDATAPAAPSIVSPAEGDRVGGTFTVSGTAEANSTVRLSEGTFSKGSDTADTSGNWSIQLTGEPDGSHSYIVKATDDVGNTSAESNPRTVEVDSTKPTVESTTPLNQATGVGRGTNLTATFSEKMKASTIKATTFKLYKVNPDRSLTQITDVVVTLSTNGLRATLNPFGPTATTVLAQNTKYKAVVTTGARDAAGNSLRQPKSWRFTTR